MANENYLVILPTGECFIEAPAKRVATTIPDGLLKKYAQEARATVPKLLPSSVLHPEWQEYFSGVSFASSTTHMYWAIKLNVLRLQCRIKPIEDGKVITPDFEAPAGQGEALVDLHWVPPLDMSIWYCVNTFVRDDGTICNNKSYLIALDSVWQAYRLPVSNVYENCELCTGDFNGRARTHLEVVQKCMAQFIASTWNADLANRGTNAAPHAMFRFEPLAGEAGFRQLSIANHASIHWTRYCDKASHSRLLEFIEVIKSSQS